MTEIIITQNLREKFNTLIQEAILKVEEGQNFLQNNNASQKSNNKNKEKKYIFQSIQYDENKDKRLPDKYLAQRSYRRRLFNRSFVFLTSMYS